MNPKQSGGRSLTRLGAWLWLLVLLGIGPLAGAADAPGFRSFPLLAIDPAAHPGFTPMPAASTSVAFTNRLAQSRFVTNQILLNGSGVALGDVDGDGWCDLFLAGLGGHSALFRNLGGWRFTNATEQAGVGLPGLDCSGAALADLDGDGDLDLVVNTVGAGTHILLNDGNGRFTPAPGSPYNLGRGGMSLALADTDGDGDLDLYIANYRTDTFRDQPGTRFRGKNVDGRMVLNTVNGRPITDPDLVGRYTILPNGAVLEHGEADLLLRNDGGGRFTPMQLTDGLFLDGAGQPLREPIYDWTLSVLLRDLDGDGVPDLYVCNDFQDEDRYWINDGHGRFRAAPARALRHVSMFSMAADVADLDRDGIDDLFTADMMSRTHARRQTKLGDIRPQFSPPGEIDNRPQYPFNQLHRGLGEGSFAEVAWYAGVQASDWTWNVALIDVDLDGFEDALMATGHELDWMDADLWEKTDRARARKDLPVAEIQRLKLMFPRLNLQNFAFRNRGNLTFEDVSAVWHFDQPVITHGLAAADLDNDGDLDLVLNNLNDGLLLLRNDAPAPRIAVRLRGEPPNTAGIGARIRVLGGPVAQSQEITAGGRYLSSDAPMRVFAAGQARELTLEVRWRSGRLSRVAAALPNHLYEVFENGAERVPGSPKSSPPALFADASEVLGHLHVDEPFDDFASQPLLPARLSQSGPGVAWADFDGDGRVDLAIGTGRGGAVAFYRNGLRGLELWPTNSTRPESRDTWGLLAWPVSTNRLGLLTASSSWEDGETNAPAVELRLPDAAPSGVLPASLASVGALAAADLDGDGRLELFVAGRAVPGRYPEPAPSALLRQAPDRSWVHDAAGEAQLQGLGMATGAVFTDLENDGFADLVVAEDWGPIRVFRNTRGKLSPREIPVRLAAETQSQWSGRTPNTLNDLTGCWTGITSVDLDGDGRMDLVAGNWGLNSRWQLAGDHPLRLYYGDYDGNGTDEILEAVFVPELGDDAPLRTLRPVAAALPFIREVAPNHTAFSQATIARLLGPRMQSTRRVEAATLASLVLLNRGDFLEVRRLPAEAQWSPVFAVVAADFDGDGHEDVFLGQNFFAVHGDAARQDAGRGLLLHGDGKGGLEPWSAARSGILIEGEQRGAATADFDEDGRPDLVVTQNGAATRLLRNQGARPGLRVRLTGPPGNPSALGARVRLDFGARLGPSREIHGGSGYLSQDSPVVVLGTPEGPQALEVVWPGGTTTRVSVPAGAREIRAATNEER